MASSINDALSRLATKRFFGFRAEDPAPDPPPGVRMTREEWAQLSPGYRREITRQFAPQHPVPEPKVDPRAYKAAVEYAGRKRL